MRLVVAAALLQLCSGCSGVVVQRTSGVVENPVPPTPSYGNEETCAWILLASSDRDVVLQFEFFESQSQNDVLHVYDVTSDGDRLIGRLFGSVTVRAVAHSCHSHDCVVDLSRPCVAQNEPKFTSTRGNLTVTWVSDASGTAGGFRATWKSSRVVHISQRVLTIAKAVGAVGAVIVLAVLFCVFRKRILRVLGRVFRKDVPQKLDSTTSYSPGGSVVPGTLQPPSPVQAAVLAQRIMLPGSPHHVIGPAYAVPPPSSSATMNPSSGYFEFDAVMGELRQCTSEQQAVSALLRVRTLASAPTQM
jgi:hypothetical protein